MIVQCSVCDEDPFSIPHPVDDAGIALMQQHMETEHRIRLDPPRWWWNELESNPNVGS